MAIFWALHLPAVIILFTFYRGLWQTVAVLYLVIVSVYANFATHFAGWRADAEDVQS